MKVLQLCYKLPFPPNDGGAYSLYNSALCLLQTGDIDLKILAMKLKKNRDDESQIPVSFKTQTDLTFIPVDNRIKPFSAFINIFKDTSYFVERFYSKEFEQTLIKTLQNNTFDIIQLEHAYLGIYLEEIKNHFKGKIILRAQNVEHELWAAYACAQKRISPTRSYIKWMNQRLKKMESKILTQIDGLICLTAEDESSFKKIHSEIKTAVIPIGIDEHRMSLQNTPNLDTTIYHLGSMDWLPNQQGIEWFLSKVYPLIHKHNQDFTLCIAGKKMPSKFKQIRKKNLIINGEVPDALEYQSDKTILIVPLLSGGGLRVKIIEALALGKVIISTTKGANGIRCQDQENILIADTPELFAQRILECLASAELRHKLSTNAQQLYKTEYTLSIMGERTRKFYELILNS